jgi:hypothetical protein
VYEWFIVETNEVFYVGKGKNNRYKTKSGRNKFFKDMYNSHNCDVRIVVNNLTEQEAFDKEKELIKYYRENTKFRLTNRTDGGEGASGFHFTEEMKKMVSENGKALWRNPEFKEKMIKIRNDEKGVYKSKAFRDKISSLVKGDKNPNYGNNWDNNQKEHLSKVRKELGLAKGTKNSKATKIICLETGEVFELISDAMKKYNVKDESSFSIALKEGEGKRTAGGLHWRYFSEELLDDDFRWKELIYSIPHIGKKQIICPETRKYYYRKPFLKEHNFGLKRFLNEYEEFGKVMIDNKEYIYVEDYISRYMQ